MSHALYIVYIWKSALSHGASHPHADHRTTQHCAKGTNTGKTLHLYRKQSDYSPNLDTRF